MFSFLSKEDPTLQLYGKLPLAKDYLRIGCADGAARRVREWMDRTFSAAEGGGAPALAQALRFLWPERGGLVLLGTLWPSSDAGGLRAFPFALFVELKWRVLWEELSGGLGPAERWFRALDEVRERAGGLGDGAALLAALRGQKVARAPEAGERAGVDYERWVAALWPGGPGGLEALLGELVQVEAGRREPLVLPLSAELPLEPQLDAWWSVLRETGLVDRKESATLFFPRAIEARASGIPPRLILLPREPEPGDGTWLAEAERAAPLPASAPGAPMAAPTGEPGPSLAKSLCGTLALVRARTRRA